MQIWRLFSGVLLLSLVLSGCGTQTGPAGIEDTVVEYNGISKKTSELSADTVKWLEWYHTLPKEQQEVLNFVPSEFIENGSVIRSLPPEGADSEAPAADAAAYLEALSEADLFDTEELAYYYFTEQAPDFGGIVEIRPASDDSPIYRNKGLEDAYTPGNIIVYYVMTALDEQQGHTMRSVSIARSSKSDDWKIINSGE